MIPNQRSGASASPRATRPSGARTLPSTTSPAQRTMATSPPSQIQRGGPPAVATPTVSPISPPTVSHDHRRPWPPPVAGSRPGRQIMAIAPPTSSSQARVSVPR